MWLVGAQGGEVSEYNNEPGGGMWCSNIGCDNDSASEGLRNAAASLQCGWAFDPNRAYRIGEDTVSLAVYLAEKFGARVEEHESEVFTEV